MVNKFQSHPAIKSQVENNGYGKYYQIYSSHTLAGYAGIHPEEDALFLSKLYIKKTSADSISPREAMNFLINLCKERGHKRSG